MRIDTITWLHQIVEKISSKHQVEPQEVEEVFLGGPKIRFVEKGDRENEDVYMARGQTDGGRFLVIFFIYKGRGEALILSARDMTARERKTYDRK